MIHNNILSKVQSEGRTEVQIMIVLQMAGSVWKSKHFKMKSLNDRSNDLAHTVGKHIWIDD